MMSDDRQDGEPPRTTDEAWSDFARAHEEYVHARDEKSICGLCGFVERTNMLCEARNMRRLRQAEDAMTKALGTYEAFARAARERRAASSKETGA